LRLLRSSRATILAALVAACAREAPARPQLVVVIDTDLPVPVDVSAPTTPARRVLVVDTARVEVVSPGGDDLACATPAECRRDLALDQGALRAHAVSFGVVDRGVAAELRVRLFSHDQIEPDGEPAVGATAEVRAPLDFPTAGVVTKTVVVPGDAWGKSGADAPTITPAPGPPPPSVVGQWRPAQPVPCTAAPAPDSPALDGERCVPGGPLLLGDVTSVAIGAYYGALDSPRLAIVSPLLVDAYELTVARFRALHLPDGVPPPATYATDDRVNPWRAYCTLGSPSPDEDRLPVNCMQPETADAICAQLGKRLPTETELEMAASSGATREFPWGMRPPEYVSPTDANVAIPCCDGVVFERSATAKSQTGIVFDACSSVAHPPPEGPYPRGAEVVDGILSRTPSGACTGIVDVTRDGVVGLGGNVAEWTSDDWSSAAGGCWSNTAPAIDPRCAPPLAPTAFRVYFGGAWSSLTGYQTSRSRFSQGARDVATEMSGTGVRCVRSGTGGT
jgi:formylglycine-generating enzyme required for sulfatase activity